jgi:intracellular sulfur oxidation DsrE/DsrF family protein
LLDTVSPGSEHRATLDTIPKDDFMIRLALLLLVAATACLAGSRTDAQRPVAISPVIPEADGFVTIDGAAIPPQKSITYRAIFDATRAADAPAQILPALNMAGSELNALGASGVPITNAKFVVVVHGAAVNGLLDDEHYKARFGVPNPNLAVITGMVKAGVQIYVCGQQLALDGTDAKTLDPDVKVASDALIVLMTYQNQGYALLSF